MNISQVQRDIVMEAFEQAHDCTTLDQRLFNLSCSGLLKLTSMPLLSNNQEKQAYCQRLEQQYVEAVYRLMHKSS